MEKLDYIEIGNRIQECRRKRKITQDTLAKKIGVTSSQISHIETGITRPSLDVLAGICEFLHISADELIFGTDKNKETAETSIPAVDTIIFDCPAPDQKIIVEVCSTLKRELELARLNAYAGEQSSEN